MIPLLKPQTPSLEEIAPYFEKSRFENKFTNFGPCFNLLTDRLSQRLNRFSLPVNNGTSAIRLALQTHFKRYSIIAIPDFTHIGTLNAVIEAGMKPLLIKCDPNTFLMDKKSLTECFRNKLIHGAIIVSPFGYRVEFEEYDSIASRFEAKLVYDLAGAWGMEVKTDHTHTYSLHATKNFSCGEGGIVCFKKSDDWEISRKLSNFDTNLDRTIKTPFGGNLKANEWLCATALAHLDAEHRILSKANKKSKLISYYQAQFENHCITHDRHLGNAAPSLCVLKGFNARELELFGKREKIEFKQYYIPLHSMPGIIKSNEIAQYSVSDKTFESFIALPCDVTENERMKVIDSLNRFLGHHERGQIH